MSTRPWVDLETALGIDLPFPIDDPPRPWGEPHQSTPDTQPPKTTNTKADGRKNAGERRDRPSQRGAV